MHTPDMETSRLLYDDGRSGRCRAVTRKNPAWPSGYGLGCCRSGCAIAYEARRSWSRVELMSDKRRCPALPHEPWVCSSRDGLLHSSVSNGHAAQQPAPETTIMPSQSVGLAALRQPISVAGQPSMLKYRNRSSHRGRVSHPRFNR